MENEVSKIVDFYFTNSLDDLISIQNILESNDIPFKTIRNNNNHPYFGINSSITIEKNLYNYVIQIPENFIEAAESVITEDSSDAVISENPENSETAIIPEKENEETGSIKTGYFVLLLLYTHFSRYFLSLKKVADKKRRIILLITGIVYLVLSFCLLMMSAKLLSGSFDFGIQFTLLSICLFQTILNLIDFIIERNKLQKILFIILGILTALMFIFMN